MVGVGALPPLLQGLERWSAPCRVVGSRWLVFALLLPLMGLEAGTGVSATPQAEVHDRGALRWRRFGRYALWALANQACFILSLACGARAFGLALPMALLFLTAVPILVAAALPASVGG